MKGDFTRDTFDRANGFLRVLLQQGRVHLDADWNEQVAVLLAGLQSLAVDLVGPHGGPAADAGFEVTAEDDDGRLRSLRLGPGRYYVDGLLCENAMEEGFAFDDQPWWPAARDVKLPDPPFLLYLDVWEQHLTSIEAPAIAEVALGGPDTSTRTRLVYQVRAVPVVEQAPPRRPRRDRSSAARDEEPTIESADDGADSPADDDRMAAALAPTGWGRLRARARPVDGDDNPCVMPPSSRYRGVENQLYRVEVHRGGAAGEATFKFSRDNGSVCFPIRRLVVSSPGSDGAPVTSMAELDHIGRDERHALQPGDWVQVCDDDSALDGRAGPLLEVEEVDNVRLSVVLAGAPEGVGLDPDRHPLLRRWDQREGDPVRGGLSLDGGAALVVEGEGGGNWLELEDGVQIQFPPAGDADPTRGEGPYRTGDYWLIPARTAIGDVEWPRSGTEPLAVGPRGVVHHYAPLARVRRTQQAVEVLDRRRTFAPLAT